MKILLLTNEYPPHIYGGAGVHVERLSREMAALSGGDSAITAAFIGRGELRSAPAGRPGHDRHR